MRVCAGVVCGCRTMFNTCKAPIAPKAHRVGVRYNFHRSGTRFPQEHCCVECCILRFSPKISKIHSPGGYMKAMYRYLRLIDSCITQLKALIYHYLLRAPYAASNSSFNVGTFSQRKFASSILLGGVSDLWADVFFI